MEAPLNELALFAGAGGGILGGKLLGWRTVCAVEIDQYARRVLLARQRDGCLPRFPIWDNVTTFDGNPWRGKVDVISGGFPCQDISAAGKGAGIDGARSGMWSHMARIIGEVRPRFAFVENSPMLTSRGLGRVLGDLAALGYDARWGVLGADDIGAPHRRKRIWIVANAAGAGQGGAKSRPEAGLAGIGRSGSHAFNVADSNGLRKPQLQGGECDERGRSGDGGEDVANAGHLRGRDGAEPTKQGFTAPCYNCETPATMEYTEGEGLEGWNEQGKGGLDGRPWKASPLGDTASIRQSRPRKSWYAFDPAEAEDRETDQSWAERVGHIWGAQSSVGRVANGVAHRMDRLKAIGNGQVPSVAALAWHLLGSNGGE
jgi:DNA (cytosine-5)-methyltransferase 1